MPDVALMPSERIKRHARKRTIQTLLVSIVVGLISALIVAGIIYWFHRGGRFR